MKVPHADLHRLIVAIVKKHGGEVTIPMDDIVNQDRLKNDLEISADPNTKEIKVQVMSK